MKKHTVTHSTHTSTYRHCQMRGGQAVDVVPMRTTSTDTWRAQIVRTGHHMPAAHLCTDTLHTHSADIFSSLLAVSCLAHMIRRYNPDGRREGQMLIQQEQEIKEEKQKEMN